MYTDQQLLWAAQIAYFNIDDSLVRNLENGEFPTLQQILIKQAQKSSNNPYAIYFYPEILEKTYGDEGIIAKEAKQFIDDVIAGKICQGWKVVSVKNEQEESGMFALTIETGENEAIVAFRGSEAVNTDQLIKDWGWADFCSINGKATAQEEMAYQYLKEVGAEFTYDNLTLTGHSLGGNLAHVATIYAYEDAQELYARIRQSVNFDGQGHPQEYIQEHQKAIDAVQDKLMHYQWSAVGTILTSFCQGDNYQTVLSDKFSSIFEVFLKHATESLRFNEDGSLIRTEEKDWLASEVDKWTDWIDEKNDVQLWAGSFTHIVVHTADNCNELYKLLEENKVSKDKIENYTLSMIQCYGLAACWFAVSQNPNNASDAEKKKLERLYSEAAEQYIASFKDLSKEIYDTYGPESDIFFAAAKSAGEFVYDFWDFAVDSGRIAIDVKVWLDKMCIQIMRELHEMNQDAIKFCVKYMKNMQECMLLTGKNAVDVMVSFGKMYIQAVGNSYETLKDVIKLMVVLQDSELFTSKDTIEVMVLLGKMYIQEQRNQSEALQNFIELMKDFDLLTDAVATNMMGWYGKLYMQGKKNLDEAIKEFIGFMKSMQESGLLTGENIKDVIGALAETLAFGSLSRSKMFKDFMESLLAKFRSASVAAYADPLVFDMDGDGFELLTKENGVYFDEDTVGLREKTEWVGADDALLAVDWNGDGVIGDGSELFGTSTLLRDGGTAKSGFEALAQYDDNGDGRIDAEDEIYSRLVMWQDKNGDGISQEDELYTLEQLGIESISLQQRAEDGVNVADVNFKDGTSGKIGEFIFDSDLYDTIDDDELEISEEIKALPNVRAMGSVESLHVLMQRDETGTLMAYVEEFEQGGTLEERWDIVQRILYFITGADKVMENSRGNYFDAQKLNVIERLMGQDFVGTGGRNPVSTAAPILEELYRGLAELYYTSLMADSYLKEYINMTFWTTDKEGKKYLDTSIFDLYIQYGGVDEEDAAKLVGEISRYIRVCNPDNQSNFENYLAKYVDKQEYVVSIVECAGLHMGLGTEDNDEIRGSNGSNYSERDVIYGGDGDDELYGGSGNDILIGGAGDDYLNGDWGVDTYIYNRGDGNDTINNWDKGSNCMNDRLVFGEGIKPEEIVVTRSGRDMILTDTVTGQKITIEGAFQTQWHYLYHVEFADGTAWTQEDLQRMLSVIQGGNGEDNLKGSGSAYGYTNNETFYGGEGNDTIHAANGNDVLYGEEGDDVLYGEDGDDILIGGAGDDYLNGGYGVDTYIYNRGDGNDRIYNDDRNASCMNDRLVFGEGIRPEEIALMRSGYDLILTDTVTGQTVTLLNAHQNSGRGFVENIEFADGTLWNREIVEQKLSVMVGTDGDDEIHDHNKGYGYTGNTTIYGGDGNDKLYGEHGDDTLIGGAGDDYLDGGYGSDTYIYNRGDGNDTIYNSDPSDERANDCLVLGGGIRPEEIAMKRDGKNLVLTDMVTGQTITVRNAFEEKIKYLENILFEDGTVWGSEYVSKRLSVITGTDGADKLVGYGDAYGYDGNESIYGGAGDDYLDGGLGNDTLYGGEGDDKLYGGNGNGNDILVGGAGDDYLNGGYGSDTYIYNLGDGNDTIRNDRRSGETDTLMIGTDISELTFSRTGNHLLITVGGEEGSISVENWYLGSGYRLDSIQTSDGYALAGEQVDLLIQAMASFESTNGMEWQDALRLQDEQAVSIAEQYWVKQVG